MSASRAYGILTLLSLIAAPIAGWAVARIFENENANGIAFLVIAALLVLALIFAGMAVKGCYDGVLIDGRGRLSQSRLQMAAWTVLILSAWAAAILTNISEGVDDPGDVAIPGELLALMGIATTTLVGSAGIKTLNANAGRLYMNRTEEGVDCSQARVSDLIQGESRGTAAPPSCTVSPAGNISFRGWGPVSCQIISTVRS
jgi:hypothetical protein